MRCEERPKGLLRVLRAAGRADGCSAGRAQGGREPRGENVAALYGIERPSAGWFEVDDEASLRCLVPRPEAWAQERLFRKVG